MDLSDVNTRPEKNLVVFLNVKREALVHAQVDHNRTSTRAFLNHQWRRAVGMVERSKALR